MYGIQTSKVIGILGGLVLAMAAWSSRAADTTEQQALIDESRITLQRFLADPEMTWLHRHIKESRGLLIIPSLLKAGFVIGGSGGSGVLLIRDKRTGKWSQPAFYTMGAGSIGLQAGASAAEVVLMVRTDKGVDALLSTKFELGAEASVAAGPVGAGAKVATADVLSFARSKGAFLGASFEGAVIKPRDKWNRIYYGKPVSPSDILVRGLVSNPNTSKLRAEVTRAAQGR